MFKMVQFDLIDGEFSTEEAREILMNLFSEKIRFHEVQILAKQERIKAGSGERMRKPGDPGAPTAKDFKESAKTAKDEKK